MLKKRVERLTVCRVRAELPVERLSSARKEKKKRGIGRRRCHRGQADEPVTTTVNEIGPAGGLSPAVSVSRMPSLLLGSSFG